MSTDYDLWSTSRDILLLPLLQTAPLQALIKTNDQYSQIVMEAYDKLKTDPNYSQFLGLFYDKG